MGLVWITGWDVADLSLAGCRTFIVACMGGQGQIKLPVAGCLSLDVKLIADEYDERFRERAGASE